MIIYIAENQGCAYSICSEGALYYTPLYQDGSVNVDDWSEVDFMSMFGEEEYLRFEVDDIHDKLISMNKSAGFYYQNA
jgi:hypothetical protein|tara:strand:- start:88 stop:321 length:234 start_codon:yes stop_codon:yes gene_type:complete